MEIQIKNLTKDYDGFLALEQINLNMKNGNIEEMRRAHSERYNYN
jgi:ABC-type Fe3+/spermidine/putrescine transport system ATPase subunit